MCDRRILSSDPHDWDELVAEATGAERYSRRLSERITEGYESKFDTQDDPGGRPALGFRRTEERHLLQIGPEPMRGAVGLFERYALGNVSAAQLEAETGLAATRIRMILMNPIYNGWIRRGRGVAETRKPAAWRSNPPVSDELWARVEEVRRAKTRGGGPRNRGRVDLLGGLLECVCGRRIRSDGTFADGRHRKLHPQPCEAWGDRARLGDETWETPILAQVAGIELDDATISAVVAALGSTQRPIAIDRARFDRQLREVALAHAAERLTDDEYLARRADLLARRASLNDAGTTLVSSERAVEWLRVLGTTWRDADAPEARADLLHAIYERITVAGPLITSVRLTPAANAHGLALALPEVVMARPTGVGRALATYRMPIEGRDEWIAAVERLA
jgi:hypothetical protein